ncbi:Lar family restriction alleviation protein [Ralstonia pickettii]|uniref:Lar family restriction alleviation protein n=1 Tax=Ralstonia pickettii TaxID=329 RepID=UPI002041B408|nr:Lar family restriction alleviation protein [Ralstonia pickettii]MCM3581804.1 Lar family restriction alleviation protein [Ralstonia pickettii]
MSEQLLPCPFCNDDMSGFVPTEDGLALGPGLLYVTCDCGAMGAGGKTVAEAIEAWNRRAGNAEYVIDLLVAAGIISAEKVEEARAIARQFQPPATSAPTTKDTGGEG